MAYQENINQYFARLDARRKSTRLPNIVDNRSEGRPYLEPEIPQFRKLAELKQRIIRWTFWWRKKT